MAPTNEVSWDNMIWGTSIPSEVDTSSKKKNRGKLSPAEVSKAAQDDVRNFYQPAFLFGACLLPAANEVRDQPPTVTKEANRSSTKSAVVSPRIDCTVFSSLERQSKGKTEESATRSSRRREARAFKQWRNDNGRQSQKADDAQEQKESTVKKRRWFRSGKAVEQEQALVSEANSSPNNDTKSRQVVLDAGNSQEETTVAQKSGKKEAAVIVSGTIGGAALLGFLFGKGSENEGEQEKPQRSDSDKETPIPTDEAPTDEAPTSEKDSSNLANPTSTTGFCFLSHMWTQQTETEPSREEADPIDAAASAAIVLENDRPPSADSKAVAPTGAETTEEHKNSQKKRWQSSRLKRRGSKGRWAFGAKAIAGVSAAAAIMKMGKSARFQTDEADPDRKDEPPDAILSTHSQKYGEVAVEKESVGEKACSETTQIDSSSSQAGRVLAAQPNVVTGYQVTTSVRTVTENHKVNEASNDSYQDEGDGRPGRCTSVWLLPAFLVGDKNHDSSEDCTSTHDKGGTIENADTTTVLPCDGGDESQQYQSAARDVGDGCDDKHKTANQRTPIVEAREDGEPRRTRRRSWRPTPKIHTGNTNEVDNGGDVVQNGRARQMRPEGGGRGFFLGRVLAKYGNREDANKSSTSKGSKSCDRARSEEPCEPLPLEPTVSTNDSNMRDLTGQCHVNPQCDNAAIATPSLQNASKGNTAKHQGKVVAGAGTLAMTGSIWDLLTLDSLEAEEPSARRVSGSSTRAPAIRINPLKRKKSKATGAQSIMAASWDESSDADGYSNSDDGSVFSLQSLDA